MSAIEGVGGFISGLENKWSGCKAFNLAVVTRAAGFAQGTERQPILLAMEGAKIEAAENTRPLTVPLYAGNRDGYSKQQKSFERGLEKYRPDGRLEVVYGLGFVPMLRFLGGKTPDALLAVAEVEFDTQERALVLGVQRSSVLATPVYSYPDSNDSKVGRAWLNSPGGSGSGLGWKLKVDCLDGNEDAKGSKRVTKTARIGFGPVTFELPYSDDRAGGGVRFSSPLSDMITAAASHLPVFAAHRQMIARSEVNGRGAGSGSRQSFSESCSVRVVIGTARSFSEVFAQED